MARTKGPLFSLKARGSIGGAITFQGGIGPQQVHIKKTPPDKRTAVQVINRAVVSQAATEYKQESQTVKDLFDSLATSKKTISGYNLYQKIFLLFYNDWSRFKEAKFKGARFGGPENKLDNI